MSSWSMKAVLLGIRGKFSHVNHISCDKVEEMRSKEETQPQMIDTRQGEEFEVSCIPGARHVDFDKRNIQEIAQTLDPSKPIVCYCSVGYRSSIVASELASHYSQQGVEGVKIYNMEGGIFEWVCQQKQIVRDTAQGQAEASTVHPYSPFWGRLLPDNLRHSNL